MSKVVIDPQALQCFKSFCRIKQLLEIFIQ